MVGRIVNNKYRVERKIAESGLSVLHEVFSIDETPTRYALKVLKRNYPENSNNEEYCLSHLKHHNIVCVKEMFYENIFDHGNSFCIVMEYVDGISIAQLLKYLHLKKIGLASDLCDYIMHHILDALEYMHTYHDSQTMHDVEIVHCDISPSNIMIDREGNIKIVDFGISEIHAKKVKRTIPRQRIAKGKMPYMSPEQMSGKLIIDGRSDLFSAAVVFFKLLVGVNRTETHPQTNVEKAIAASQAHLSEKEIRERINNAELQEFFIKALKNEPQDRFQSAKEMRDAMLACIPRGDHEELKSEIPDIVNAIIHTIPNDRERKEETIEIKKKLSFKYLMVGLCIFGILLYCFLLALHTKEPAENSGYCLSIRTIPEKSEIIFGDSSFHYNGAYPVVIKNVQKGFYTIRCKKQGFQEVVRTVSVWGKNAEIKMVLPFTIPILLNSNAEGATVIANEDTLNKKSSHILNWPFTKQLTLRIEKPGYLNPPALTMRFNEGRFETGDASLWKIQSIYLNDLNSQDSVIQYCIEGLMFKKTFIHTMPEDLEVIIDGKALKRYTGNGMFQTALAEGEHEILAYKRGFQKVEKKLLVDHTTKDTVHVSFDMNVKITIIDEENNEELNARIIAIKKKNKKMDAKNMITPCEVAAETFPYSMDIYTKKYGVSTIYMRPGNSHVILKLGKKLTSIHLNITDKHGNSINESIAVSYMKIVNESGNSIAEKQQRQIINHKSESTIKLESGTYRFRFSAAGYMTIEKRITVAKGTENRFNVTMIATN